MQHLAIQLHFLAEVSACTCTQPISKHTLYIHGRACRSNTHIYMVPGCSNNCRRLYFPEKKKIQGGEKMDALLPKDKPLLLLPALLAVTLVNQIKDVSFVYASYILRALLRCPSSIPLENALRRV